LDVGQGDAILLRTEEGDVLIDAGTEASQQALCVRLAELGVRELSLAIFTHADEDHIGGADGVLRSIPTHTVWISRFFEDNLATRMLREAATDTGAEIVEVYSGMFYSLGSTGIAVLSPYGSMDGMNDNDASIVLKIACGDISALLMGDATAKAEKMLLDSYEHTMLKSDVIKAGHHGAATSSGKAFLQAVEPEWAIVSCGAGNFFGHPHGEALLRFENVGARILRTDLMGDVILCTDGTEIWQP
jgi:beta-lactamase superfamily II metal-dependent hydrolase